MNDIIEIRNLNKGDIFLFCSIPYVVEETDKFFKAVSFSAFPKREMSGPTASRSKQKVRLIKRANENTNI